MREMSSLRVAKGVGMAWGLPSNPLKPVNPVAQHPCRQALRAGGRQGLAPRPINLPNYPAGHGLALPHFKLNDPPGSGVAGQRPSV